ncbi:TetR/AcrR family transcriptional regulator [Pseudohoeflea coraliihabitans]|uniref:TetR/AcrR family transcriptional regulator n=1 Tax=Pseudohoeflea coraliihabitans TaxID=2860393 RepID=A0ABS6WMU9_9HYPH|nr:TetR/AcrR family transcriptional regulator [Pseudohoeflea sp. DP4N28-3]MBW3097273.1 TetR/AcrR family transcriptional regulator [Pseudohoeflea sp. DP4N28-3]
MQQKNESRSNKARTEATRLALISAARRLFSEKGYAETSTPEIVTAAGVTRGALYHHFEDKLALFRAVVRQEYAAVADEITTAVGEQPGSALDALRDGSRGYLKAMSDKGRVRIMLLDGPAVLGQSELSQIDRETSADALRTGLSEAMDAGHIQRLPLEALTVQLSALFDRAALAVSEGDDPEDHLRILDAIFAALK